MGNMVADAMRAEVSRRRCRATPTPAGCVPTCCVAPPSAGEQPGEITWGEMFAVLPFGNRTVIDDADRRAAGARRSSTASRRAATRSIDTGRFPQISGLEGHVPLQRHGARSSTEMWKAPDGVGGTLTPIGPTDTVRVRHQRLHVHRWRRLHGLPAGHGRAAARRRPAAGRHRLRHRQLAGRPGRRRPHHRAAGRHSGQTAERVDHRVV